MNHALQASSTQAEKASFFLEPAPWEILASSCYPSVIVGVTQSISLRPFLGYTLKFCFSLSLSDGIVGGVGGAHPAIG